jgi:hypothetical protein
MMALRRPPLGPHEGIFDFHIFRLQCPHNCGQDVNTACGKGHSCIVQRALIPRKTPQLDEDFLIKKAGDFSATVSTNHPTSANAHKVGSKWYIAPCLRFSSESKLTRNYDKMQSNMANRSANAMQYIRQNLEDEVHPYFCPLKSYVKVGSGVSSILETALSVPQFSYFWEMVGLPTDVEHREEGDFVSVLDTSGDNSYVVIALANLHDFCLSPAHFRDWASRIPSRLRSKVFIYTFGQLEYYGPTSNDGQRGKTIQEETMYSVSCILQFLSLAHTAGMSAHLDFIPVEAMTGDVFELAELVGMHKFCNGMFEGWIRTQKEVRRTEPAL